MPSPYLPRAALAAGVPSRFLYWSGRSGRRYLFTCTDWQGLADFGEGVAISVAEGGVVWSGEIAALAALPSRSAALRAALYVHLLAPTAEARRAAIEDLRPVERPRLRLAA